MSPRHDIAGVLTALVAAEARCLPQPQRQARRFLHIGTSLVQECYALGTVLPAALGFGRRDRMAPPLRRLRAGRVLRKAITARRYRASSAAQSILLDRNVRGFYLSPRPVTIKVQGATASEDALRREVEVRRQVEQTRTVRTPRLLGCGTDAPTPFLCEELIAGRSLRPALDDTLVLTEILPAFWRLYAAMGIREIRAGDFFDLGGIRGEVGAALTFVPAEACRRRLSRWLEEMDGIRQAWLPGSLGHGDLSHGNVIADGAGLLWVVDWETARPMPLLWDWRKLMAAVPGCAAACADAISTHYGGREPEGMLALPEQRRLVGAARVAEVAALMRRRGATAEYARRRLTAAMAELDHAFDDR